MAVSFLERNIVKYTEKLRDPRWQRKRLEVMERDEFTCSACGDEKSTLNVHHKQYHGDPWAAPMDSLETLCETCHQKRSDLNKRFMALDSYVVIESMNAIMEAKDMQFIGWFAMRVNAGDSLSVIVKMLREEGIK